MRVIPNTRPQPVQVTTSGGAVSTPSSAAGTRANANFNALVRQAEANRQAAAAREAALGPVVPSEVIFDALQRDLGASLPDTALRATVSVLAVEALREAGFDL